MGCFAFALSFAGDVFVFAFGDGGGVAAVGCGERGQHVAFVWQWRGGGVPVGDLVIVKWLVLSRSMRKVLHYYGAPRLPLWGFILVSEALLLPLLLVLYVPALAAFALLWQAWVFVVQVRGLMWMGNATVGRVLVGYLVYGIGVLCVGTVILMLFIAAGWLDMETLNQNLQVLTSARK